MYKLLIVDDHVPNIRVLERLFQGEYYCLAATSGEQALAYLQYHEVAVIISDQRIRGMTSVDFLKLSAERCPLAVHILLTGDTDIETLVQSVNCGLVYMYVTEPWNDVDMKLRVQRAVMKYEENKRQNGLLEANNQLRIRIKQMKSGFVRAIAGVLKMKDEFAYFRGIRVGQHADFLATHFSLNEDLREDLNYAAALQDVGLIGIPDQLMTKRRTPRMDFHRSSINDHAAQVLACFPELRDVSEIVRFQTENYDGSGGPIGLVGEQIPIASRILRVASEYDHLTNPRDPFAAITHSEAIDELRRKGGKFFDIRIIQALSFMPSIMRKDIDDPFALPAELGTISRAVN